MPLKGPSTLIGWSGQRAVAGVNLQQLLRCQGEVVKLQVGLDVQLLAGLGNDSLQDVDYCIVRGTDVISKGQTRLVPDGCSGAGDKGEMQLGGAPFRSEEPISV
jgi:hypothetical protein